METKNFYPNTFQEIPERNNPAFRKFEYPNGKKIDDTECLIIVKESDKVPHSVVLHISYENAIHGDSVVHVAKFWDHDRAVKFCEDFKL